MTYPEFLQHLKKGSLHNAYFFCGTEDFLIDDCLRRLTKVVITDPSTRDFNYDLFYADQVDAGRIMDAANAYPMLADWRMVVVKDVQRLAPSGLGALVQYLENPSATTKLVLTCDKLSRNKQFARLKALTCFTEFKPLYDSQIPKWISDYLKQKGLDVAYDASLLIHAHVGNNLRAIVNELDKIVLNLGDRKTIEEADVQRVVGLSRKFSVFNLNDAIGNHELEKSMVILNQMLETGESHTGILAMLSRHFVNLIKVKGCVAQRKSQQETTVLTGIPPFFVSKTKEMASKYSFDQLENALDHLLYTDLILKTSQQPPKIALQTMLLKILR